MTSDDVVPRILAAIEAAEQVARAAAKFGGATWSVEPFTPSSPDALPAVVWVVDETEDGIAMVNGDARARHIARNDPDAVLRRCAADRRRLERHTPIPDHGRFSDDWATECPNPGDCDHDLLPPVCGVCRDQVGDPLRAPCPDLLDLADSYGVAPAAEPADTPAERTP